MDEKKDIVDTLRMCARVDGSFSGLACGAAADEIERLRATIVNLNLELDNMGYEALEAEARRSMGETVE